MTAALLATVAPAVLLLAVTYPLRPQCGRMRPKPVPVRRVLAKLSNDEKLGLIPADRWGGTDRPSLWTVSV